MTDRIRPEGETSDFHGQRTVFAPQQQTQQAGNPGEQGGTYEPNDSRTVTGTSGSGVGSPGGSDQQVGGERWGGQSEGGQSQGGQYGEQPSGENLAADQQAEAESSRSGGSFSSDNETTSGSYGASQNDSADTSTTSGSMGEIREHMEVIGADGIHVGTVDHLDGNRIKLTKVDSGAQVQEGTGSHEGHHHYISRGLVAEIEGDTVRLSATAANAHAMEEEE